MVDFTGRAARRGVGERDGGLVAPQRGAGSRSTGNRVVLADGGDGSVEGPKDVDAGGDDRHHGSADHDHDHGHGHDHTDPTGHGDSDHHADHDHHAHDVETLGVGVLTVSTSRTMDDDPAGDAIVDAFEEGGHEVATRELVPDDYDRIQDVVNTLVGREDVNVVVTTGGTGVTPDDVTIEAVEPLFEKGLPGFGELFRRKSEAEIGTRVIATRADAGIADGVPVFCLPGSEAAVRLGISEIVLPEAGHLSGLARRNEAGE